MNHLLRTFKERRDSDEGFTLIELMVVVLIIGILLAIAVPTFLNAQNNAKTKAATSNLRSSLSAVKTVYADAQTYAAGAAASTTTPISATVLKAAEPSLTWTYNAGVTSAEEISFNSDATGTIMGLATRSSLGECFYIIDNVASTGGGTTYVRNTASATTCTAITVAPTASTTVFVGSSPKGAKW